MHLTNIKIGSATIEETNNIKFLGIIFDEHLTFKNHVDVIARKTSKSVFIIIIIKRDWQCKVGRERSTPYQSEDPNPTTATLERKKRKGKQ